MRESVETAVSISAKALGLDLRRAERSIPLKYKWLRNLDIKTVVDVGANKGQFAKTARMLFPNAEILSFEPIRSCFLVLESELKADPRFHSFNFGLGDEEREILIHVYVQDASSSFLEGTALLAANFPLAVPKRGELAIIKRLDDIAPRLDLRERSLLKVDVQGYEMKVLRGGASMLRGFEIILIETSFSELYVGQPLFAEIYQYLSENGFRYTGNVGQMLSPLDGTILQEDSVFRREAT